MDGTHATFPHSRYAARIRADIQAPAATASMQDSLRGKQAGPAPDHKEES
jgi:hypothetical protein